MENMFVLHSGRDLLLNHVHKLFTLEWPCLSLFSTQKSCSESESRIMRFFCTAGRGTEIFAYKEISDEINNDPDSVCISFIYCLLLSRISLKFFVNWLSKLYCTYTRSQVSASTTFCKMNTFVTKLHSLTKFLRRRF